ncbi:hypothetical protein OP455_RS22375, partial [Escherichia coli]
KKKTPSNTYSYIHVMPDRAWKGRKKIPGEHRSHIAPKRGNAATFINRNLGHLPALPSPTDSQTTMTLICAAECRS